MPEETAWRAQLYLLTGKKQEETRIPEEILGAVILLVWASKKPRWAKNAAPVKVKLKPGAQPVRKKQLKGFLGMGRQCWLRIPSFRLIAKQLHAALKRPEGILEWTAECCTSFDEIKRKLMEAPTSGWPNLRKPFQLYVHERQQVALGVLTQKLGNEKRPVGYFSKQLGKISKCWPACLKAVALTITLTEESQKLTLGQPVTVFVPHAVSSLLENKRHRWISLSRLAKYQAVLVEQDDVTLSLISTLNIPTLPPISESN